MAVNDRSHERDLAWQMLGVEGHNPLEVCEKASCHPFRPRTTHSMDDPMAHCLDRPGGRLFFNPIQERFGCACMVPGPKAPSGRRFAPGALHRERRCARTNPVDFSRKSPQRPPAHVKNGEADAR
jgi:hypothetical protein